MNMRIIFYYYQTTYSTYSIACNIVGKYLERKGVENIIHCEVLFEFNLGEIVCYSSCVERI